MGQSTSSAPSDALDKFVKGEDFVVKFNKYVPPPPKEEGEKQADSITFKVLNRALVASHM